MIELFEFISKEGYTSALKCHAQGADYWDCPYDDATEFGAAWHSGYIHAQKDIKENRW